MDIFNDPATILSTAVLTLGLIVGLLAFYYYFRHRKLVDGFVADWNGADEAGRLRLIAFMGRGLHLPQPVAQEVERLRLKSICQANGITVHDADTIEDLERKHELHRQRQQALRDQRYEADLP